MDILEKILFKDFCPSMPESESGRGVLEKVKWANSDVYLSQTMKRLEWPTSVESSDRSSNSDDVLYRSITLFQFSLSPLRIECRLMMIDAK